MMQLEPRYLTGPSLLIVGGLFLYVAYRLYLVHPINRVFKLGPYITERGMTFILNFRPMITVTGLLILQSGLLRTTFWYFSQNTFSPIVQFLGSLEAGLSVWAAYLSVRWGIKIWRSQ